MRPIRPFSRPLRPRRTPEVSGGAPEGTQAEATATQARPDASPQARAPWPDIAPLVDGSPPGRLPQKQARLWSLVLRARRVPHRVRSMPGGYTIQVPARFARQAVDEILLYHKENVSPHPSIPLPEGQERSRPTVAVMLCLCAFFALTQRPWPLIGSYPQYWHSVGVADAAAMLSGQLWRAATALTLHADPAHVASNAVVGGVFLILLARRTGSGTAWLLAILSGVLGNLLNALAYALAGVPGHLSVGFSTAVFGAAGVLAGLKAFSGEGDFQTGAAAAPGRGWLVPVAAGLALVATLGTAGENTDIGAHVFGLVAGFGLGGGTGRLALRLGRPDEWAGGRANVAFGALAALIPVLAWAWGWLAA
ncbi:MAG: rhomboid family intramembrane serine protease [Desulfovibrio sp.]|nr:rhomboid family intramembrane serine protease [Desulfovibrio sp.]